MELHADGFELLQIDVRGVNGEGFTIRIPASNTGKDLQQEIALQIPSENWLSYFAAAWVQQAVIAKKPQRARLPWRNYA